MATDKLANSQTGNNKSVSFSTVCARFMARRWTVSFCLCACRCVHLSIKKKSNKMYELIMEDYENRTGGSLMRGKQNGNECMCSGTTMPTIGAHRLKSLTRMKIFFFPFFCCLSSFILNCPLSLSPLLSLSLLLVRLKYYDDLITFYMSQ